MLSFLKIAGAFLGVCSVGFFLARWADQLNHGVQTGPAIEHRHQGLQESPNEENEGFKAPAAGRMAPLIASYLESEERAGAFALEKKLTALSLGELEELYIEALSHDMEDRRAFEAAGLALEAIASHDPGLALELLYVLTPAEKQRLATALSDGWARHDAVSAWDWIDSAWIDANGEYIDRALQNRMFHGTLDVVLSEQRNYQLATDLLASVVEPELRLKLADLIAFYVVSENPAQTLDRLDFTSDAMVDSAIMDAVIGEWAQRDSVGAVAWTLENEDQVTSKGARSIAKDLVLNGVFEQLETFHGNLQNPYKRDSVASESARLLARRSPTESISWLAAIESSSAKYNAYYDSLYEIGHDDFSSSVRYAELAYGVAELDRETALFEALQSWTLVAPDKVRAYLDSSDGISSSGQLNSLRESVN